MMHWPIRVNVMRRWRSYNSRRSTCRGCHNRSWSGDIILDGPVVEGTVVVVGTLVDDAITVDSPVVEGTLVNSAITVRSNSRGYTS